MEESSPVQADTKDPSRSTAPGKHAEAPRRIPLRGWWQVVKRVVRQLGADHIQVVSAGVAFYFFLSLFPAIAAFLSFYGVFASASDATSHLAALRSVVPDQAFALIEDFAIKLTTQDERGLGWGAVAGILLSVWSTNKGTKALFEGINLAYNEPKRRGFFKSMLLTLGFTLGSIVGGVLLIVLIAGLPALRAAVHLPPFLDTLFAVLRWPLFVTVGMLLLALVYTIGPQREKPHWRWVTPGAVIAILLWLAGSLCFGWYLDSFGTMAKTYGSLAAIVILMLWFFIGAFAVLLGAEVNSECEHQTATDTTTGPEEPMGERGAHFADRVVLNEDQEESEGRS